MSLLSRKQPIPLYYQIEMDLRRAIESGDIANRQLPPEEQLARRYAVSRVTLRAALQRLEEDGLIERHRGRGTFVRQGAAKIVRHPARLLGFEEDLRRQGATPELELLGIEEIEAPSDVRNGLELEAADQVCRVRRRGLVNGQPLWLEVRYCPVEVTRKLRENRLTDTSFNSALEEALGRSITSARLRVETAAASQVQARQLGIPTGHPLLINRFVLYDAAQRPMSLISAAFRGDRYAFSFDLPPVAGGGGNGRIDRLAGETTPWPRLELHLDQQHSGAGETRDTAALDRKF